MSTTPAPADDVEEAMKVNPWKMRGSDLLLQHCGPERASAAERLAAELGPELARRLVADLSSQVQAGRRGSSSP
jgi:hypothetical protein